MAAAKTANRIAGSMPSAKESPQRMSERAERICPMRDMGAAVCGFSMVLGISFSSFSRFSTLIHLIIADKTEFVNTYAKLSFHIFPRSLAKRAKKV
jgi:hypothetical protein